MPMCCISCALPPSGFKVCKISDDADLSNYFFLQGKDTIKGSWLEKSFVWTYAYRNKSILTRNEFCMRIHIKKYEDSGFKGAFCAHPHEVTRAFWFESALFAHSHQIEEVSDPGKMFALTHQCMSEARSR